jgi:hypothetical protein
LSTITTSRTRASLALATVIALLAAMFMVGAPKASATPSPSVVICHATNSESNPYTRNRVNMSSVEEEGNRYLNGHGDHTGPVWFEGIAVKWGDIIPKFTYTNPKTQVVTEYAGYNLTAEGLAILENGCKGLPEVIVDVALTGSECQVGETTDFATLTVTNRQSSTESIDFTLDGPGSAVRSGEGLLPGASQSFNIAESDFGTWVLRVDGQEATQGVNLTSEGCPADIVAPVTPEAPTFVEATCTTLDGAAVQVPKNADAITYKQSGTPAPGATVTVKATANEGYTIVEGATTEWVHTYTTVAELNCPPPAAVPAAVTPPTFTNPTCEVPASMSIPADTAPIAYTTVGTATPGTTVTVTAKPIGNVVLTGYPTPGWIHTFTAAPTNCDSTVAGTEDTDTPTDDDSDSSDDEQVVAGSEDELAATGANAGPAGLALLLILSGAAFVTARRLALK